MLQQLNIEDLFQLAKKGGFTYDPLLDCLDNEGYAVSEYKEYEVRIPYESLKRLDLLNYLITHQSIFIIDPRARYGAWYDTESDEIVLDISAVYYSKSIAIQRGIENDQDAIYDLSKGEEIRLR